MEASLTERDQKTFLIRPLAYNKVQLQLPTTTTTTSLAVSMLINVVEKHIQQLFMLPPSLCNVFSWNMIVDVLRFLLCVRSNYLQSLWLLCAYFRICLIQSHKNNKVATFTCELLSEQKIVLTAQIAVDPCKIENFLHAHCHATAMLFSSFPVSTLRFSMALPKDLTAKIQFLIQDNLRLCIHKNILSLDLICKHGFSFPDKKYHALFLSFATDHVWQ